MAFNLGDFLATLITIVLPITIIYIVFKAIANSKKQNQETTQKLDSIIKKLDELNNK